ncbi:MAG: endonuclease domain-containing protein [Candidatus Rokubacteria bacterium]|nr:endonuclease domain-containing protein [Candidatus Rokubacteria bacterium]
MPSPPGERARVRGGANVEPKTSWFRHRARELRRDQTEAERKLWARLRDRQLSGAKFRRQHPIGRYTVDFCCPELSLVVEVDGGQHAERADADRRRTEFLTQRGYRVLRFWDTEVLKEFEAVLERIAQGLRNPHPNPLPSRERGQRSD